MSSGNLTGNNGTKECCVTKAESPRPKNRPGQNLINYRLGTHATFLRAMLDNLHRAKIKIDDQEPLIPLRNLDSFATDDPTIALLDAWAATGDVLSFYQERIANEGFLETATERRSVLELARQISYELNPGVAAGAYLAFTVDDSEGSPGEATIPVGTQVQSIPVKSGELPQTFETSKDFTARADWNELKPRRFLQQNLAIRIERTENGGQEENEAIGRLFLLDSTGFLKSNGDGVVLDVLKEIDEHIADYYLISDLKLGDYAERNIQVGGVEVSRLYLKGVDTGLNTDDPILFVGQLQVDENGVVLPKSDDDTEYTKDTKILIMSVFQMDIDQETGVTCIDLKTEKEPDNPTLTAPPMNFIALEPEIIESNIVPYNIGFGHDAVRQYIFNVAWDEPNLQALLMINEWERPRFVVYGNVQVHYYAEIRKKTSYEFVPREGLPAAVPGVYGFAEQVSFFGHNAQRWESLPDPDNLQGDPYPAPWEDMTIWTDSQGAFDYRDSYYQLYLERVVDSVTDDSWLIVEGLRLPEDGEDESENIRDRMLYRIGTTAVNSLADYGISGKVTALDIRDIIEGKAIKVMDDSEQIIEPRFLVRKTTSRIGSYPLHLAPMPFLVNPKEGDTSLLLDGPNPNLQANQPLILTGEPEGVEGIKECEILRLNETVHIYGYTLLRFKDALTRTYTRETVSLTANVVHATHGETVRDEILGSGSGAQINQRFTLAKPPLTYVSAVTPSGNKSTLTVRVENVAWKEAPFLYGSSPNDRNYIIRIDNESNAHIVFGDGIQGARLPTGESNIRATYRSGIGMDGQVSADRLTLLKTRPHGIRAVSNPLGASGAGDPETMDGARTNAPLTTITLDRIVSLKDFEDFARAFAGIGKARAVRMWNGWTEIVYITVAGEDGKPVNGENGLCENLLKAINLVRDPLKPVEVGSFAPRYARIKAGLDIDTAYEREDVEARARQVLAEALSFERREFGQSLTSAEIISILHEVDGILAVDINELYSVTDPVAAGTPTLSSVLPADSAELDKDGTIKPDELLMGYEAGIEFEEMSHE